MREAPYSITETQNAQQLNLVPTDTRSYGLKSLDAPGVDLPYSVLLLRLGPGRARTRRIAHCFRPERGASDRGRRRRNARMNP